MEKACLKQLVLCIYKNIENGREENATITIKLKIMIESLSFNVFFLIKSK